MRSEESHEEQGAPSPDTSHGDRAGAGGYQSVAQPASPVHPSVHASFQGGLGAAGEQISPEELKGFISTLRSPDEDRCTAYINDLLGRGINAETIFLELLDSAAVRLGEMWDDDDCDFVDVTVALGRLQRILRDLSHQFLADRATTEMVGRVLLSSIPGEQHTLGLFMVAEFFIREGWDVRIGAPLSASELGSLVRETRFDVVGFSVASSERLSHVKRTIRQLRRDSQNRSLSVLVGGPVFRERPTLATQVGADGTAGDARTAPTIARLLISQGDAC